MQQENTVKIDAVLPHCQFVTSNTILYRVVDELCHTGRRVKNIHTALIYGEQVTDPSELPELKFPKIGKLFDTFSHLFVYFSHGKSARNHEISSRAFKNVAGL